MGAPRPPSEKEERRSEVVDDIDENQLREDEALAYVAEAARMLCGVSKGHVSLMEDDFQCVVGHSGFEMARFDRDDTFCAYTVAESEVTIVENAEDDERFADNPFVLEKPGISFYVGLPILVEDAPIGTLCAIDSEPKRLDPRVRSDLFGLVHALESYMKVVVRHGEETVEREVGSRLLTIRAEAVKQRFRKEGDVDLKESLRTVVEETGEGFELLEDLSTDEERMLGVIDTAVEEE